VYAVYPEYLLGDHAVPASTRLDDLLKRLDPGVSEMVIARSSRVTDPTSSNRPVSATSTDSKCRARKSASGGAKESPSKRRPG
jgi:hypothetical protein